MKTLPIMMMLLFPALAAARPVSYPGGTMLMTMNDGMQHGVTASYSPDAWQAFGVGVLYLREEKTWLHSAQYNRLLARHNGEESQANVYVLTGLGVAEHAGDTGAAGTVGMEADWETRRLYVAYENRFMASSQLEQNFTHKLRFGVAPYKAAYDAVQPWFMLQFEHTPEAKNPITVTPLVRVFSNELLGEVGISNQRDVMFNLTYQF
jgi:hypothetical protein